jgi:hypothetical protein
VRSIRRIESGCARSDVKHNCIHGIGILSAALPGSKFILHCFPRFPAWAKYCRAPRWSIASWTFSFFSLAFFRQEFEDLSFQLRNPGSKFLTLAREFAPCVANAFPCMVWTVHSAWLWSCDGITGLAEATQSFLQLICAKETQEAGEMNLCELKALPGFVYPRAPGLQSPLFYYIATQV